MWLSGSLFAHAGEIPAIQKTGGQLRLIVDGKPFLIFGGELGNLSSGTADQAETVLPKLAQLHVNTALIPVAWEQVEPVEGRFDFGVVDCWIDVARQQHMHLALLWFGSWMNAFSSYAPVWVKQDTKRFPRAISAEGGELEILPTLGKETLKLDSNAFSHRMAHIREKDAEQQTVLMVQVENEVGYLGRGRDRSAAANWLFHEPVPSTLVRKLEELKLLSPELNANFRPTGKTSPEVFMAWNYAKFIEAVTAQRRRLNGVQSNQGRQLSMQANQIRTYRVVLYTGEQEHHVQ
jgi:beta-galactosidase GanA